MFTSKELKTQLIEQCMKTVGNDLDGRRPLNIAVMGPPGCGKSSFLNTIFACFKNNHSACWNEIAKMEDYGGHGIQETSSLRM
jgi:predicted GTPase